MILNKKKASFLIIAVVSGVLYVFGCRNPNGNQGFRIVEDH